jgi:hypothetical protein
MEITVHVKSNRKIEEYRCKSNVDIMNPLLAQVCNLCPEIILKAFANYRKYLELKYNLTAQ